MPRNTGEGWALLAAFGEAEPAPECGLGGSGFLPMPHAYQVVTHGRYQYAETAASAPLGTPEREPLRARSRRWSSQRGRPWRVEETVV